jgi:RNA polymerase sigma-70 factor (ECF subfamily)
MSPLSPRDAVPEVQALFVQHIIAIRGFVFALIPDHHRAADVVQEVFVTITAKAESFERGTNFKAWACAIARNKVLQAFDRMGSDKTDLLSPEIIETLAEDPGEYFAEQDARLPYLAQCVERLAPQARRMVSLRYNGAQPLSEIAQDLGWTVESVKVALAKARAFLRKCVTRRMSTEMR